MTDWWKERCGHFCIILCCQSTSGTLWKRLVFLMLSNCKLHQTILLFSGKLFKHIIQLKKKYYVIILIPISQKTSWGFPLWPVLGWSLPIKDEEIRCYFLNDSNRSTVKSKENISSVLWEKWNRIVMWIPGSFKMRCLKSNHIYKERNEYIRLKHF